MRILLASNHHRVLEFDRFFRLPSLNLASIAANLDRDICDVKIVDLIAAGFRPKSYFLRVLKKYQPDVVGLTCMVYQYAEALELAKIVKTNNPKTTVVMGGYGPTVLRETIIESADMNYIDFIIWGEGEYAFNELIKAIKNKKDFSRVPNLSFIQNGTAVHTSRAKLIDLDNLRLPDRNARIIKKGFYAMGFPVDSIETSRGCVLDCSFCTIREMYGKSFRKYKIERIIEDITDARKHGARGLFIVDDNITLDGRRYMDICDAIIYAKLDNMQYGVQASVRGLKQNPGLIKKMADSGTKIVFLGIESFSDDALEFMHKSGQFKKSDAAEVIKEMEERHIGVLAGIISGYPDDTEESIWANFRYCREIGLHVPVFYILSPFPKTKIRDELMAQGLVTNPDDFSKYTGFEANVRTKTVSAERLKQIREEMGFRYPVYAGVSWHMLMEFPILFSAKLFFSHLIFNPKEVFGYTKEIFRLSNIRNYPAVIMKLLRHIRKRGLFMNIRIYYQMYFKNRK